VEVDHLLGDRAAQLGEGGSAAPGATCNAHADCAADGGDPVCIADFVHGWPDGYCSEFCGTGVCPGGSHCVDLSLYETPVCLDDCDTAADCRAGYGCLDLGGGTKVCIHL